MIRHMISGAVDVLTPSRNGMVVIRYESNGRTALVDSYELNADEGINEINSAISKHNADWDYSTWQDAQNWHNGRLQVTA